MKKTVLLFLLVLTTLFCFTACGEKGGNGCGNIKTYTVSFILTCEVEVIAGDAKEVTCLYKGRSSVAPVTVKHGDQITDLNEVTCTDEAYSFECWVWKGKMVTPDTVFSEEFFGTETNITLQVACSSGWTSNQ